MANIFKKEGNKVKIFDHIIAVSLSLAFLLIPLFFTGLTAQGLVFEKMILFYLLTLIALIAWVIKCILSSEIIIKKDKLAKPLIIFTSIYILATIFSVNIRESFLGNFRDPSKGLLALIIFIIFYFLVINNADKNRLKYFSISFIISSLLVIIYSALQIFGKFILPFNFTKYSDFNSIGSILSLSIFLVILLPILTVFLANVKDIFPKLNSIKLITYKIIIGLLIVIDLFILLVIKNFTFWPAAIVSLVILLMFYLSKIIKIEKKDLIIPISVFIVLIIFLALGNLIKFNNINLPIEVNLTQSSSWDIAKKTIKNDPILGSGPSTFAYDYTKYKNSNFNLSPLWNIKYNSPSGILYDVVTSVGILGLLAFIWLIYYIIKISYASLFTDNNENKPILLSLFSSFITVIIFSLFLPINGVNILILILISSLMLAYAKISGKDEAEGEYKFLLSASPKYSLIFSAIYLLAIAGVAFSSVAGIKIALADYYYNKSLYQTDVLKRIEYQNKSTNLSPYYDNYFQSLANSYMEQAKAESQNATDQNLVNNYVGLAIDNGKKAVELSPKKADNYIILGMIYENTSPLVENGGTLAENNYNEAKKLDPSSPIPFLRLASLYSAKASAEKDEKIKSENIKTSLKKYDEALALKNNMIELYQGKAITYMISNDINNAIDIYEKGAQFIDNNTNYIIEMASLYFQRAQSKVPEVQADPKTGVKPEAKPIPFDDDIKKAENALKAVIEVQPNNENAYLNLVNLYKATGKINEAKANYKKLFDIVKDDKVKEALKKQFPGY